MAIDMAVLNAQFASLIESHVGRRIFNDVLVEVIESDEETAALAEAVAREVCGTTWGHEMDPRSYAHEIGMRLVHRLNHGSLRGERTTGRVLSAFLDCVDRVDLGMYCMGRVGLQNARQARPLPDREEHQ